MEEHNIFKNNTFPTSPEEPHYFRLHVEPAKEPLRDIFENIGRQVLASAVILILGFFLLNWSAYYQIGQSAWQRYFGTNEPSSLNELAVEVPNTETLTLPDDLNASAREIPDLNLEVIPNDNRIVIPRINQNIPIIRVSSEALNNRDWDLLESEMQEALKGGVVHYPGTGLPGQGTNTVITGHSSYFPWDPGRFKDVFALLHQVEEGDKIVTYYQQKKYIYEVKEIKIILPDQLDVLSQTSKERLTLITCTPVGTNLKRLVVIAEPVSD